MNCGFRSSSASTPRNSPHRLASSQVVDTSPHLLYTPPNRSTSQHHSAMKRSNFFIQPQKYDPQSASKLCVDTTPLEKFQTDISRLKKVLLDAPDSMILSRRYTIVQEKVIQRKPLTAEQFQALRSKTIARPVVITYGLGNQVFGQSRAGRVPLELEKEKKAWQFKWCCSTDDRKKDNVLVNEIDTANK